MSINTRYFTDIFSNRYKGNFKLELSALAGSDAYQYSLRFRLPDISRYDILKSDNKIFIENLLNFEKEMLAILDPEFDAKNKKLEFYENLVSTLKITKEEVIETKDENKHLSLYLG